MFKSCKEIISLIEQKFPTSLSEGFDNAGLLLGDPESKINKILVCLDVNEYVVEHSIKNKVDLIVCHHPIIFKPLNRITRDNYLHNLIYKLIESNIAVYAMHTNFDNAKDGMNDILSDIIGLKNAQELNHEHGTGRFGLMDNSMTLEQLCMELKILFNVNSIRLIGDPKGIVRQIAIVGGAGADFINDAIEAGCDVIITGDVKYHEALDALYSGINVIDAGHYSTEVAAMPYLAEIIGGLTGTDTICSPVDANPFLII